MVLDTESQPSKLQREVNETIRHYVKYAKPTSFKNLNEFSDFKIDLWEVQYKVDTRIRDLFDGFNTNFIENFYDTIILNPYIKAVPFYKQLLMLLTDEPVLYGGARGGGKDIDIHTPIPTPEGFKQMEELMVGDEVFDEKGNVCNVTAKSDIFFDHECFELVFDDGSSVVTGADHQWLVDDIASRRSKSRAGKPKKNNQFSRNQKHKRIKPQVRTTKEIYENLTHGTRKDTNFSIDVCDSLDLDDVDLLIDPYILGLWLGDGTSSNGGFITADKELLEYFELNGYKITKRSGKYEYGTVGLHTHLRELNLLNNKHIPEVYLRGSKEQRLSLIQGLMDTDGNSNKNGSAEFVQKNEKVIDGLIELLRSFGIKVTKRVTYKKSQTMKTKKPYFEIKFTTNLPIFRLKRKLKNIKQNLRPSQRRRMIKECNPVPSVPTQCITVDSDSHLYLCTENFIPTHNSEAVLMSALQYVDFPEWRAGIFRLTNPDLVQPKGILNRCEMWAYHDPLLKKEGLQPHYSRKYNIFTFPSGAELKFGHMQHEDDVNKYQGAEFHEISLDECTQFSLNKITKIKGSNRKGEHDPLPLRVRYTGNPGGVSHEFFNNEFIRGDGLYIDSFFFENPYLNHIKYQRNLEEIRETNPVLYEQWRNASWSAKPEGRLFKREWFIQSGYDMINESIIRRVRFWDLASTEVSDTSYSQDPDWTVGVLAWLGKSNTMYIKDVIKFRKDADEVIEKILSTAKQDGYDTAVRIEKEGLSSGNFVAYNFSKLLKAYDFDAIHMGNRGKIARAEAMIHSIKYGTVKVPVAASWLEEYIGELTSFPTKGVHDDQVDATSGAFAEFFEVQESAFDSSDFDRFMDWNELN